MTTVCCLLVRGHIKAYNAEYVKNLAKGVAKFMDRPYEFVCFTDQPNAVKHIARPIVVKAPTGRNCWWAKLEAYNPAHQLTGRVLYLDLDTMVIGPLAPILDYPAAFALAPDGAPNFHGSHGLTLVKKFNGSVIVLDGGSQTDLYTKWSRAQMSRLWSDQDWIAEQAPHAQAMPIEWFPRLSAFAPFSSVAPEWPAAGKVLLTKKPKNHDAAKRYPWFAQQWRAA